MAYVYEGQRRRRGMRGFGQAMSAGVTGGGSVSTSVQPGAPPPTLTGGAVPGTPTLTGGAVPGSGTPTLTGGVSSSSGSWAYAPIVVKFGQTQPSLFNQPMGNEAAWRLYAEQLLVQMGYADPNNQGAAQGAVYALAQAFAWYSLPGTMPYQTAVQQLRQATMVEWLSADLAAMATLIQVRPTIATVKGFAPGAIEAALHNLYRAPIPTTPPDPPPPGAPVPPPAPPAMHGFGQFSAGVTGGASVSVGGSGVSAGGSMSASVVGPPGLTGGGSISGSTLPAPSSSGGPPPGPPQGAAWLYDPLVVKAMQAQSGLFTNPLPNQDAWRAYVGQLLASIIQTDTYTLAQGADTSMANNLPEGPVSGPLPPNIQTEVNNLAQAYSWYAAPGSMAHQIAIQRIAYQQAFTALWEDAVAMSVYAYFVKKTLAPGTMPAHVWSRSQFNPRGVLVKPAGAQAAATAPSSTAWWLLGIAAIGAGGYYLYTAGVL